MTVTGQEILDALRLDPKMDQEKVEKYSQYILQVPSILVELLNEKISAKIVLKCNFAFQIYCARNGALKEEIELAFATLPIEREIFDVAMSMGLNDWTNQLVEVMQETYLKILEEGESLGHLFTRIPKNKANLTVQNALRENPRMLLFSVDLFSLSGGLG